MGLGEGADGTEGTWSGRGSSRKSTCCTRVCGTQALVEKELEALRHAEAELRLKAELASLHLVGNADPSSYVVGVLERLVTARVQCSQMP
jgi:hypothetical protein